MPTIKDYNHRYYLKNKQKYIENAKRWREANRDRYNALRRSYRRCSEDYSTTDVAKGTRAEIFAKSLLEEAGFSVTKMASKDHFDFLVGGQRLDVKSSQQWRKSWTFATSPEYAQEKDYYFCVGYIGPTPVKAWCIPAKEFPTHGTTIASSGLGKYEKYAYWSFRE